MSVKWSVHSTQFHHGSWADLRFREGTSNPRYYTVLRYYFYTVTTWGHSRSVEPFWDTVPRPFCRTYFNTRSFHFDSSTASNFFKFIHWILLTTWEIFNFGFLLRQAPKIINGALSRGDVERFWAKQLKILSPLISKRHLQWLGYGYCSSCNW